MQVFNEDFNNFLTECRNDAVKNLEPNERYTERKNRQEKLHTKLISLLNPEIQAVFEEYSEAYGAVQAMEYNAILLCGLTMQSEILKRFDTATAEYKAFAGEYL